MGEWQNLSLAQFNNIDEADEVYGFPIIEPVYELPNLHEFIEFDYCARVRRDRVDRKNIAVHFFEKDCKFERVWTHTDKYSPMLSEFGYIIGPDFSQYIDMPVVMQMYNHYRNNWLVRYWQTMYNMTVIPTIMWGDPDTFDWCFTGYPHNSIVAVSNVGVYKNPTMRCMFETGYNEMLERLSPKQILVFSRDSHDLPGNVTYINWEPLKGVQLNGNR